jgi:hypothetical protein
LGNVHKRVSFAFLACFSALTASFVPILVVSPSAKFPICALSVASEHCGLA